MDFKLDKNIQDIIEGNNTIDPSVLIGIEKRRQAYESVTKSIKQILDNAPMVPEHPKETDNISEEIVNYSNYDINLKEKDIKSISELLSVNDATIDKTTEIIRKIDRKIVPLVDEINAAITQVKSAYDARITIGCRSNLIWKGINTTTSYQTGSGTAVTFSNYTVIKNPQQEIVQNYYGLKYYQKPSNRDYGFNIVSEFKGNISVGGTIITVLGTGTTIGIQTGDEITDNLIAPTAFSIGNIPRVVGFGTTSSIGITTTIIANVSTGSSIISPTGIGTTDDILIGDYIIKPTVFSEDTRVVGFGSTTTDITYYDVDTSSFVTVSVDVVSIIVNNVSISSATNEVFDFGSFNNYESIILDTTSNSTLSNQPFTVIRQTEDITQNFNYTNNPIDPITIGIIDNQRIGTGHKVQIVNNGASSGPTQWREITGESEPAVGAGNAVYYSGTARWPYVNTVGYASEGRVYRFKKDQTPTYTSTSPTGINTNGATCGAANSNITSAEANLQVVLNRNLPQIQELISATVPIRKYREANETKAWAYLQSISYLRSEISKIKDEIITLGTFDYNAL
jgi:hypothetical protein